MGCAKEEDKMTDLMPVEDDDSWLDVLAQSVIKVPPAPKIMDDANVRNGSKNFRFGFFTSSIT